MIKRLLLGCLIGIIRKLYKATFILGICLMAWYLVLRPRYLPRLDDIVKESSSAVDSAATASGDSIQQPKQHQNPNTNEKSHMGQR